MKINLAISLSLGLLISFSASANASKNTDADAALWRALVANDLNRAAAALDKGARPNQARADGSLPIAWAVESQNPQLVQLLLKRGATVDSIDANAPLNANPLILACQRGDAEIVTALLGAGAPIAVLSSEGTAPLALCAAHSNSMAVQQLLAAGAPVDAVNHLGQTALMWAASRGRIDIIEQLLAQGANINATTDQGSSPIFFALQSGSAAANFLADAGADLTQIGPEQTRVLQMALYQKRFDFAARMIEAGADVTAFDRNGHQPLHVAILAREPALVELLLAKGAPVNSPTAPSKVVWRYEVNFTSAPYQWSSQSPIMLAAKVGAADLVERLAGAGADVNFTTDKGLNLVHAAMASNGATVDAVTRLTHFVNTPDANGRTPLHHLLAHITYMPLSEAQVIEMFLALRKAGARTDLADSSGKVAWDLLDAEGFNVKPQFIDIFQSTR